MKFIPSATLVSSLAPQSRFTGDVWLDEVVRGGKEPLLKVTRETFSPGSRSAWHMHPLGQALYVLSGSGWVQIFGEPAKIICPGDSAWIEADELHWHGADDDHLMVHLAIQGVDSHGVDVIWMDKATETEYSTAHD